MNTQFSRAAWGRISLLAALTLAACRVFAADELQKPFRVAAGGRPVDVQSGFAAPYVADFDGDGRFDLLIGQRAECKLRIYRNIGSPADPKFGPSAFFRAGGVDASLPGG